MHTKIPSTRRFSSIRALDLLHMDKNTFVTSLQHSDKDILIELYMKILFNKKKRYGKNAITHDI